MKNKIILILILLSSVGCSTSTVFAFLDIKAEMDNAYNSFEADMRTAYHRASFESLHSRYNNLRIIYTMQNYKNPESYKNEFNAFFSSEFPSLLWEQNLILNFREWFNPSNPEEALNQFYDNNGEYKEFLKRIRGQDQILDRMPPNDILKIGIYSYFIVISGGIQKYQYAKERTFIWPFCRKKR